MPLATDTITEISRSVAAEHSPKIHVVGVASSEGGSDRVELLITIAGCHKEPCRFLINVPRTGVAELEAELRTKLREALRNHTEIGELKENQTP
jgi:hypothetical protein